MEQLKQLGGRLLGKKSVAIILGLMGLCVPMSLSAEKLDTTFVLDMVIDSTPCYYTKYDSTGDVMATGRYIPSDYFRINIGYVTDGEGRKIDTLVYACDRVTRQWNKIEVARKDSFHMNGMLWFKNYKAAYSTAHPYYLPDSIGKQTYKSSETFFSYSMYGYYKENRLSYRTEADEHGSHVEYIDRYNVYLYDSHGNLSSHDNTEDIMQYQPYPAVYETYKNEYDDNHNLVSYVLVRDDCGFESTEEKVSYAYDEYNRRVKEIRYLPVDPYSNSIEWVFHDSTVYVYEGTPLTHPHISSLIVNEKTVAPFEEDACDYWFDMEYDPNTVSYELPDGVVATKSYDESTHILTLTTQYENGDATSKTEYRIHYTLPSISFLFIDGEQMDSFSPDIYDYWLDEEYTADLVSYDLPYNVDATESYDDSTHILTLTTQFEKGDATSKTEYHIHFRPTDGVDDFLGDQVSLYVMDKTICVDGAEEPLFVYDLLGSLVGTGRGEEVRIPVPQTGVYVVKAGGKATKVVVR